MGCTSCERVPAWRELSRAAAKSASARLRGMGMLKTRVDWAARAAICESCPLRFVFRNISYCGRPLLSQLHRTASDDGCGCPTREKAKDPTEHCPIDAANHPARIAAGGCTCKWCGISE